MYEDYEGGYDNYNSNNYEYDGCSGDQPFNSECDNIPEEVVKFLIDFKYVINEGLIFDIQNLYEHSWPKLSEQYFEKISWPDEFEVMKVVGIDPDEDGGFMILYKELYFRHIYARLQNNLTINQRFGSFSIYCELFNYILSADDPVNLELPDLWLWELIDEFIYQFQSFSQYKARLNSKSIDEINMIHEHSKVWNILCVLNVLHSLINKSNIKQQLEVYSAGGDPDTVAGEFGKFSFYKMLGYFALVGLLRLHSLLGDYYQAVRVLDNIEIHKKYTHVPACRISMAYYVGFAYMMMRRYSDAIRTFSSILIYIQRTKQLFQTKSYQNDQINKQTHQMYHLLAICLVLHPQCIDESIQKVLREEKYHEKMIKMQYGDIDEFEACFLAACPKFICSSPPPRETPPVDYINEAIRYQTQVFMDEVREQKLLPIIRSYLKLYTTLPLSKLGNFILKKKEDSNEEQDKELLRAHLLCFKHKMKNIVWTKGTSGLDGQFHSGSEIDFYIDHDMIHIADTKVANRYGDFFIRKIIKLEELYRELHTIKI